MAENTVVYYGTGRRKNAVARVRIVPGTGKVTVNKRDAAEYFGRKQLVENALAPFKVTDTAGTFDVIALCDGGGITGQSGALRLGIGWLPDPRRPRRRAQEVRPQEGPPRSAVLQALSAPTCTYWQGLSSFSAGPACFCAEFLPSKTIYIATLGERNEGVFYALSRGPKLPKWRILPKVFAVG